MRAPVGAARVEMRVDTPNLPTNIVEFKGFDSSIIFIEMGGIPRSIGNCQESLSQEMLVGIMLVGRLGVLDVVPRHQSSPRATRLARGVACHGSWVMCQLGASVMYIVHVRLSRCSWDRTDIRWSPRASHSDIAG